MSHHSTAVAVAVGIATVALASAALAATPAQTAFLTNAIKGDNSEIMLGKLAQDRGTATRDFGSVLVTDHTQAREQAEQVANQLHAPVPTGPTADARRQDAELQRLSGAAFDRVFVKDMLMDHEKDIAAFERQGGQGAGPVADLAKQTLPTLRKHLHIAEDLKSRGV